MWSVGFCTKNSRNQFVTDYESKGIVSENDSSCTSYVVHYVLQIVMPD